jgi:hypothetical protein
MQNLLSRLINKIKKPSAFFRFGTVKKRELYISLSKIFRSKELRVRKTYAQQLESSQSVVDARLGYLKIENWRNDAEVRSVLREAELDLANHFTKTEISHHKKYLQNVAIERSLDLEHPYMKLALSPKVTGIATEYMGYTPILSDILLWHSPNDSITLSGSQFFHLDYADISQVKLFLLISDVDHEAGPTTLIPADISRKICLQINYKLSNRDIRVPDEVVNQFVPESRHVQASGPAGTLFFTDTSRCLHYGSRGGTKSRTVLLIQFVSPFSFRYGYNFKKDANFSHLISPVMPIQQKLLLGDDADSIKYGSLHS